MIKYLFLVGLFYVAYKMFTQPSIQQPSEDEVHDDDFIDYEEVDE